MKSNNYLKFAIMLTLSFLIMYGVMFLNADELNHGYLSATRAYMTFLMVAPMAVLMLLMMPMMYGNAKLNVLISIVSVIVFVLSLIFLRAQTFISDEQYMKAMIPHHSSAIQVSENAKLRDPQVRKLARRIIQSQEREIEEMRQHLQRLRENK